MKYEKLDQMILDQLNDRPLPFRDIFTGVISEECEELAARNHEGFRVLDRRLQSLKKQGLIRPIRGKGWVRI